MRTSLSFFNEKWSHQQTTATSWEYWPNESVLMNPELSEMKLPLCVYGPLWRISRAKCIVYANIFAGIEAYTLTANLPTTFNLYNYHLQYICSQLQPIIMKIRAGHCDINFTCFPLQKEIGLSNIQNETWPFNQVLCRKSVNGTRSVAFYHLLSPSHDSFCQLREYCYRYTSGLFRHFNLRGLMITGRKQWINKIYTWNRGLF